MWLNCDYVNIYPPNSKVRTERLNQNWVSRGLSIVIREYPWICMNMHEYAWISMNIHEYPWTGNPVTGREGLTPWRFQKALNAESIMMVAPLWSLWRPSLRLKCNQVWESGSLDYFFFGSFGYLDHILTFNLYTPHFLSTSSIGCMLNHECGWYSYFTCHTNTLFVPRSFSTKFGTDFGDRKPSHALGTPMSTGTAPR